MRLYTESYFEDKEDQYLVDDFLCLDDGKEDYTSHDIALLFKSRCEEKMKQAEDDYQKEPQFLYPSEKIDEFFTPTKFPKYDLVSRKIIGYMDKEEAYRFLKNNEDNKRAQFESRPPFDEEKFRKDYMHRYQSNLIHLDTILPKRYQKQVNPRIAALGYLPKDFYDFLCRRKEEAIHHLQEKEKDILVYLQTEKNYSKEIQKLFFHTDHSSILGFEEKGDTLTFYLTYNGITKNTSTGVTKYDFHHVSYLRKEDGLPFLEEVESDSPRWKLKGLEIHSDNGNMEAHFLLQRLDQIKNLIFTFSDMESEENYLFIKVK